MEENVYLLTGTNIGNRLENIELAAKYIEAQIGNVIKKSAIYESAAWGEENQSDFLNQAIQVKTNLSPEDLIKKIREIEKKMGKEKKSKWGPRIIDIDILFYGQKKVNKTHLTIPHEEISNRRFTLIPLNEIAPEFKHPVKGVCIEELLKSCPDKLPVNKFKSME